MSDENTKHEVNATARHDEWTGTPFQGWKGSEREEREAPNGKEQQEIEEQAPETEQVTQTDEAEGEGQGIEVPQESQGVAQESAEAERPSSEAAERAAQPVGAHASAPSEGGGQSVDYSRTFRSLSEGDVVTGVVVHIDKEGVLVDVGTKSEGIVRPNEISRQAHLSPEDVVQVGDRIDVYVMQSEDQDGSLILSKKRADFERAWERVEDAHRTGKVLSAMVTDRVKGGLVVDLGIRGFVPASHVGSGKIKNLERYVGQSISLKVIEVDRERRKVVLSNRLAAEQEREHQRAETLKALAEGEVRTGIVRRITDYGAFVDLGGIDGLLHISEMSWTRIKHPSDVVRVGDKIQVMVLKLNLDQGKVSLGLRQILPDPWSEIDRKYHVGDVITGTVSRLVPFGAFVQVDGGIEGIIPNNELAIRRVSKPEDVVSVGDQVEVKIIDLRPEERRMTLSIRHLQQQKERERERVEAAGYSSYSREESKTTIGDLVGDMIREARFERRERKRREREAEEKADLSEELEEMVEPMFAPEPDQGEAEETAQAEAATDAVMEAPAVEEIEAAPAITEEAETSVEIEAAPEVTQEAVAAQVEAERIESPPVEEPVLMAEAEQAAEAPEEPVAVTEPQVEEAEAPEEPSAPTAVAQPEEMQLALAEEEPAAESGTGQSEDAGSQSEQAPKRRSRK